MYQQQQQKNANANYLMKVIVTADKQCI